MLIAILLPTTYYEGVSRLWGGCAYVGSTIVAAGLTFQVVRSRPDASSFVWLLSKVLLIGIATLLLREWLMRVNDIALAFGGMMRIDPTAVDDRFVEYLSGRSSANPDASAWDIIWGTQSLGTAICYALLWLFGWLAWGVQYIVKLVGDILLTAGWALSPIFLAFFMIPSLAGIGHRYLMGLVALVMWPFGWVIASVVTNAMLDAAALANLVPVFGVNGAMAAPMLTILLLGAWMLVTSVLAPWVTTRILLMGANPAAVLIGATGSVAQSAFSGGVSAGVAAITGGAGGLAALSAVFGGAMSAGTESAARGGGAARTTRTAIGGLSGLYAGRLMRRHAAATEESASAQRQNSEASEAFASVFTERAYRQRSKRTGQPHHENPNQAAIELDQNAKPKS